MVAYWPNGVVRITKNCLDKIKTNYMIQNRAKIVLTRRWPSRVETQMAQLGELVINEQDTPMSAEMLSQILLDADVVCPTVTDNFPEVFFTQGKLRTKLLANFGVGFNHIDVAAAHRTGVQVTNTPGVLTEATAEIALTLLLMSARRAGEGQRHVRAGAWQGWSPTHMLSTQVTGKTLGIVGMGRIGLAFARKAFYGLGMKILYANRRPLDESQVTPLKAEFVELDTLLARSDFVSLHCPSTPATHHLLNAQRLSLMQPHAHLINTARGDIIDEISLVNALRDGVIAGVGLDVYEHEPAITPGLTQLEQAVLLPHMGSGSVESREAMGMRALANVQAYLQRQPLPDLVALT